jgi:hypothetical protein
LAPISTRPLHDFNHVETDLFQLLCDRLALFHLAFHGFGGSIDPVGDRLYIRLDLPDQLLNLLGALFRSLRQGPHFVCHHRESLAMFAGACRFNGRIQCQQIGLVRDARDRLDDVADGGSLLFQLDHHPHRSDLPLRGDSDVGDQTRNIRAGTNDQRLA